MRFSFQSILFSHSLKNIKLNKYRNTNSNLYLSLWYGILYVVVEGWEALKIRDDTIDKLLKNPNKKLLKDFRNGVFHFQKNYNDKRFQKFYKSKDSAQWVLQLHTNFSEWFLKNLGKEGISFSVIIDKPKSKLAKLHKKTIIS